jgi:serine phosphatase RsbU (regulator of sigma subunit)
MGYVFDNDSVLFDKPFGGIDLGKINYIYPEASGLCWIGADDGLVRFNASLSDTSKKYFNCLIRLVQTVNDSVLYYGGPQQLKTAILNFAGNSIRFQYSAAFYEKAEKTQYSYLLEGYMQNWSDWDNLHQANFVNLREGTYTFRVKARNAYGEISNEAVYSFTILPPWYRSWWAYVIYFILIVLVLILIVKLYTYRLKQKNKKLEELVDIRTREVQEQKHQIEKQNENLEEQNAEILSQKQSITDSITYARNIQRALLPQESIARKYLDDIFILFKPRDIVSGDFYWFSEIDNILIVVAADCTGHGVPGAFMSMLGMSFLNSIVNEKKINRPGDILNHLRNYVINSLHQHDDNSNSRDGMDICLCAYDKTTNVLHYAAANNPLILVRNGELQSFDADKMPIAIYHIDRDFETHQVEVQKGDCLYLFSDGYSDQFGGPANKRFLKKNFRDKLLMINALSMQEQKEVLQKTIEDYKGDYPQTDDILVIGIKI